MIGEGHAAVCQDQKGSTCKIASYLGQDIDVRLVWNCIVVADSQQKRIVGVIQSCECKQDRIIGDQSGGEDRIMKR